VGSSHYHPQQRQRQNSSIPEAPDLRQINHLTASSQSLHAILSLTTPSNTISYPQLESYLVKAPSTSDVPTAIYRTPTTYTSLCQLNSISTYGNGANAGIDNKNESTSKSLDEHTDTTTVPFELRLNDKHLPTEVRVRCIFLRVGEIDTLNERYTSEIFFEASWFIKEPKHGTKYDPLAGHFNPQLAVLNNMGDSLRHDVNLDCLSISVCPTFSVLSFFL